MKNIFSFENFKIFESSSKIQDATLLATNISSYHFSHDDTASDTHLERIAKLFIDKQNDVWLEIREKGSHTGPYERPESAHIDKELVFQHIGKIDKPDLNKVRTLLKNNSFDRTNTRFASGFKAQWKDNENNEYPLSEIINKYKYKGKSKPVSSTSPISREDLIQQIGYNVQQLSDEKLQDLLKYFDKNLLNSLVSKSKNILQQQPTSDNVKLVDYSERAVAVFGVKKMSPMIDSLRHIGGKFNPFLVNPETGQKEGGWIFPISKKGELTALINH